MDMGAMMFGGGGFEGGYETGGYGGGYEMSDPMAEFGTGGGGEMGGGGFGGGMSGIMDAFGKFHAASAAGKEANLARQLAEAEAKQKEELATWQHAVSQRRAIRAEDEGKRVGGRAMALGAASGAGGLETPGLFDVVAGIQTDAASAYATEMALGKQEAANTRYGADVRRFTGEMEALKKKNEARGLMLSGIGGLFKGFGGGGGGGGGGGFRYG